MASVVERFIASRRGTALVTAAALIAMLAMAVSAYSIVELSRFAQADVRRATIVYASGQALGSGLHVGLVDLASTLARLGYTETRTAPSAPGQFRRGPGRWDIVLLGGEGASLERGAHVSLVMQGDRIARVARDGREVVAVTLEGEALAGMSDRPGQDYRPVRLADTPAVVVNAMLAAEDHRFFEHGPLDLRGLARATWANVRTGRIAQGGSTLTQQLVKSRLLTPQRTWLRKAREAWLALLVEWRYSKASDPRGVPHRGVPGAAWDPGHPRGGRRSPRLLRQERAPAHAGRSRAPGRNGSRAQHAFPERESRAG